MALVDSILLVDDDRLVNHLNQHLLKTLDITREVFCRRNGMEALTFLKLRYYGHESLPSLILVDINMPVVDGIAFIKSIQKSETDVIKSIPIIVLTSSSLHEDMEEIKSLGDYPYIIKPLTEAKIVEAIERVIQKK